MTAAAQMPPPETAQAGSELETRYFIGLINLTDSLLPGCHMSVIAGPGRFSGPKERHMLGDVELWPVSEAVCREWTATDDEDDLLDDLGPSSEVER